MPYISHPSFPAPTPGTHLAGDWAIRLSELLNAEDFDSDGLNLALHELISSAAYVGVLHGMRLAKLSDGSFLVVDFAGGGSLYALPNIDVLAKTFDLEVHTLQ